VEEHVSDWITVPQAQVSAFAELTNDNQYIHVNLEQAAQSPYGGTIAHGFLLVSLLTNFSQKALPTFDDPDFHVVMSVNYGFNKIRFLSPVRTGSRIRGRISHMDWREKGRGQVILSYDVSVDIEGEERPALVARWLFLLAMKPKKSLD